MFKINSSNHKELNSYLPKKRETLDTYKATTWILTIVNMDTYKSFEVIQFF